MHLKCIIIDDEPLGIEILENYISKFPDIEIVGKYNSAIQALSGIHKDTPDLIFLDIEMPKMNGIDFLRSVSNTPFVIFTTAHRNYAVEGFDYNIIDFLLKPIPFDRFAKAIHKALAKAQQLSAKTVTSPGATEKQNRIFVRCGTKMVPLIIEDIVYVEGMKDYIRIYTRDKNKLVVKQTMKDFEVEFMGYNFLRVHKSYIIAEAYIRSIMSNAVQVLDYEIPIGRNYQKNIAAYINASK